MSPFSTIWIFSVAEIRKYTHPKKILLKNKIVVHEINTFEDFKQHYIYIYIYIYI
jgi:hypothetical protein